jgi:hypothetical protein
MISIATPSHMSIEQAFEESVRINLVTSFINSGLSQKAFCKDHALKESTFKNWFYRYKSRVQNVQTTCTSEVSSEAISHVALFAPLHVEEDAADILPLPHTSLIVPSPICIDMGAFHITVPAGFDSGTLKEILSVMQAVS